MSLIGNAAVLVLGQLVSKLFTFSLNQLLLSYTSPSALGISQLIEFILDYTFFLSKEAIRLTISKLPESSLETRIQWTINYSFLPFLIYLVLGIPIIYWKIICNNQSISQLLYPLTIHHIIFSIIICVIFELLSEPYYNVNQYIKLDFKTRTKIESTSGFIKCITQFISVIFIAPQLGLINTDINSYVLGYLIGQIAYSISIYLLYWYSFSFQILKPCKILIDGKLSKSGKEETLLNSYFEKNSLNYFKSIFIQQLFKNFLTVGDKFVITSLLSIQLQGSYSFISNYGSLIARILFAPMEESTRITISSLFKNPEDKEKEKKDFTELFYCISNVIKIYIYLLILLIIFAPLNIKFLLNLIFRNFISDELIQAFKIYWFYILFLASNGILEALFQSLFNSNDKINNYSIFMFINSIIFLSSLILLIGKFNYGLNGLIFANMINMFMRITYCFISIRSFIIQKSQSTGLNLNFNIFKKFGLFLFISLTLAIFQYFYFTGEVENWKQFIISAFCGVLLVSFILIKEVILPRLKKKNE